MATRRVGCRAEDRCRAEGWSRGADGRGRGAWFPHPSRHLRSLRRLAKDRKWRLGGGGWRGTVARIGAQVVAAA